MGANMEEKIGGEIGGKMRDREAKTRGRWLFLEYVTRQNVQGDENNLQSYDIDNVPIYKHFVDR